MDKPLDKMALPPNMKQLIATVRNDLTLPFFMDMMHPQDLTLLEKGGMRGLEIYEDLQRDSFISALMQKRKFALTARVFEVVPASKEPQDIAVAEFIEGYIQRINFDQMCLDMLDATLKGFSITELIWERDGNMILPLKVKAHDPRRFAFDLEWKPRLLTLQNPIKGEELPERKFIVHRYGVKGNNPYGLGLGSKLFWNVLFKKLGLQFWLTYMSKFSSPTPIGKFPVGTLPEHQAVLLNSLADLQQGSAIVVPVGSEVSMLESHSTGTARFEEFAYFWDEQSSICVLGSNLATQSKGSGSLAATKIHAEVEQQITDADCDLLADTLKQTLCQWIIDYNFPNAKPPSINRIRPKNELDHEQVQMLRGQRMKEDVDLITTVASRIPDKDREKRYSLS